MEEDNYVEQPDPLDLTTTINVAIKDQRSLHINYIDLFTFGGLFVPTSKPFELSERVSLKVKLYEEPSIFECDCNVAWITPSETVTNRKTGIGLAFDENGADLRDAIRKRLSGYESDEESSTM